MKLKPKVALAILLPLQVIGIAILGKFPNVVEDYYSNGLYPGISFLERHVFSILPFSFGDLVYGFLIILLVRWLFQRVKSQFKDWKTWTINALASLSVIYMLFQLFWGLNYYRVPLHESLGIADEYTDEELFQLTKTLIEKSNALQLQLSDNDSTKVVLPFEKDAIYTMSTEGYNQLKNSFPELEYNAPCVKKSIFSLPLTYMGFNGYLNPLTNEAQINSYIVAYKLPTTISHEIGHQLGYAKENEANFIACLNTMNHENIYMRYSGYTFALKYCLNEVFRRNPGMGLDLLFEVNCGIIANYNEVRHFWDAYKNPFEPLFASFYSGYLKANNQPKGIDSYSYVVALLVNYYKLPHNTL